jgi:hypothetical protein
MAGLEGEGVKVVFGDKRLEQALEQVRTHRDEAEKFAADPQAYLQNKGVDTKGLRLGGELSEGDLEHVAGGVALAPSICASVGCVVCVTVGDSEAA